VDWVRMRVRVRVKDCFICIYINKCACCYIPLEVMLEHNLTPDIFDYCGKALLQDTQRNVWFEGSSYLGI